MRTNYLQDISDPFLTDIELAHLMRVTPHARHSWVKRAIKKGDLIPVKRGLYCVNRKYILNRRYIDLFELAFRIYGPSYISLESALSYHGWIPERVVTVASASMKRSYVLTNSLGIFTFHCVPKKVFYAGVEIKKQNDGVFYMARPWTALADYVHVNKKDWKGIHPVYVSLRVEEEEDVVSSFHADAEMLFNNYPSRRVQRFLKGVMRDLQ
ncbi:MAG TPA: hypothetical protein DDW49_03565 [Deltaproteobacteria bacterium]|nr:MAG: hypothetical protein A2048_09030 [Deltaproteobacteria bacterium GWA2_45_12]HBF12458.1 hypothetical protein [Deltaproteobacteria bacterium]